MRRANWPENSAERLNRNSAATPDDVAVLRRMPLFHGVRAEAVDDLIGRMQFFSATSGRVLFRQGEPGDYLYLIVSGTVRLSRRERYNTDALTAILGPTEHFGELSLLDPGPRMSTATVAENARLGRLDKASLDEWITERPEIALQMLHVVSRRLRRTSADVADMVFVDVPGRVARQLVNLAGRFGTIYHGEILIEHHLTQTELAQLVGSSRETVNRALADFAHRGWIRLTKGTISVVDRERLERRAR